jgi:hypothetical protein
LPAWSWDDLKCINQQTTTETTQGLHNVVIALPPAVMLQALKANPECAVKELKLNANYITRFGQVALTEAVDMVYEMGGGNMLTVTF